MAIAALQDITRDMLDSLQKDLSRDLPLTPLLPMPGELPSYASSLTLCRTDLAKVLAVLDPSPESTSDATTKEEIGDEKELPPRYARMVKMGVPLAAVKLTMAAEGISCGDTAADEEELPPRYAKMVKMGVPLAAVKLKMAAEGASSTGSTALMPKQPRPKQRLQWKQVEVNDVPDEKRKASIWEARSPPPTRVRQIPTSSPPSITSPIFDLGDFRHHWETPKAPKGKEIDDGFDEHHQRPWQQQQQQQQHLQHLQRNLNGDGEATG